MFRYAEFGLESLDIERSLTSRNYYSSRCYLSRFAAMQQESKALQEENTKRFDKVMKALAALSAKIQPDNKKPDTGSQYDDLGFLMNTQNLKGSFDPKQKMLEGVDKRAEINQLWAAVLCMKGIAQDDTARDYVALFERLACQLVRVPEPVLEGTFIIGLKPELRAYVRVMQQEGGLHRSTIEQTTSKVENFRRLTDSEQQAKRAKGLCYRCDKNFSPGHRCPRQTLQVLLVDESDGSEEEAATELQVKRCDPEAKNN
nr:hypothetical protein [Tanacetum cinerariifolium]